MSHKVLISTLPPFEGGVPAKARILCRFLQSLGHEVTVAYYPTFRYHPEANVPLWRVATFAKPVTARHFCFDGVPAAAVGCWLPEFEAPYHKLSPRWRTLIDTHDRHVAVGGNPLVALPFVTAGIRHFLWCASGVFTDRCDRQARMPTPRRIIDKAIIEPWLLRLEQQVLRAVDPIRCVSNYTSRVLAGLNANPKRLAVTPIPVDFTVFTPPASTPQGTIGFAGRFEDPRKNLGLLFDAFSRARKRNTGLRLLLAGCNPSAAMIENVARRGLASEVTFIGELPVDALPDYYRSLDVFVIPSRQEGFCIAGLEAMASGVPVISTRCGGPEDFVRPDSTGFLVGSADEMAERILDITGNRILRTRLGTAARDIATSEFAPAAFAHQVAQTWRSVWGDGP